MIQPNPNIALYLQLANLIRHAIGSGRLNVGDMLPSLDQLASSHQVARVTARQAVRVLVEEGLLDARRGRGTIVKALPHHGSSALLAPINDPSLGSESFLIKLLSQTTVDRLPAEIDTRGHPIADRYVEIVKLHIHDRVPFTFMRVFIDAAVFAALPKGGEKKKKLIWLLREQVPDQIASMHQVITVEPAGLETADILDCAFSDPVAKVRRIGVSAAGRISYAGISLYRGDTFAMELNQPEDMLRIPHPKI